MTYPKVEQIQLATLSQLESLGGEARPINLYPKITAAFSSLTEVELKQTLADGRTNKWTNMIQWQRQALVSKGELYREPRGLWRITEKGKERLKIEGLLRQLPPTVLPALAKKKEETPLPSHDELVDMVKQMGEILGKMAEVEWGPVYRHDCVLKENPYANPKLVVEVCDKGNLDKDIASLTWANQNWGAKGILVIVHKSDFNSAQNKLPAGAQICLVKGEDVVQLRSLVKSAGIDVFKLIFSL